MVTDVPGTARDLAFNGRILNVNLTTGAIEVESVPERIASSSVGTT